MKYLRTLPLPSIYLVNAQIARAINLFPFFVVLNSPDKSICTLQNIFGVTGIGCNGATEALLNTLFL